MDDGGETDIRATQKAASGDTAKGDTPADVLTAGNVTVRRRGGQPGNANGLTHGLRSSGSVMDFRLQLGKFPDGMRSIENAVNMFRRVIERAAIEVHGNISEYHAAVIQTAARWETHAMLARRWLMANTETLKADQRLAYSKAIADASTARDRCLERLGLDARDVRDDFASALDRHYATVNVPALECSNDDDKEGADDGANA